MRISDRAVAKLMGRVFIQQAALNLLGSVLDTPDFFWESGVSDNLQTVYDKVGAGKATVQQATGWVGGGWGTRLASAGRAVPGGNLHTVYDEGGCNKRWVPGPGPGRPQLNSTCLNKITPACFDLLLLQVYEYLELDDRIEILNSRLQVGGDGWGGWGYCRWGACACSATSLLRAASCHFLSPPDCAARLPSPPSASPNQPTH